MSTKEEVDLEFELAEAFQNLISTGFEEFQILAILRFVEASMRAKEVIPDESKRWELMSTILRKLFHGK